MSHIVDYASAMASATIANNWINKITEYTVASQETEDTSSYDFKTLEEALTFVENCSVIGGGAVSLFLEDGTHYLERNSYQPSVANNAVATYNLNHTHVFFSCQTEDSATVTFAPWVEINGGNVFRTANSKISFYNIKIDYALGGAEQTRNPHFVRTNNSYIYFNTVNVIGLNKDDFAISFYASGNSYIYLIGTTIEKFSLGILCADGIISGHAYNLTLKSLYYSFYFASGASGAYKLNGTFSEEDVDVPANRNQLYSYGNDNCYIDDDTLVAPRDNRRVISDAASRPEMDGIPDGTSYLQLDIKKPIWYVGKDSDGNDEWVDCNGEAV